MAVAPAAWGGVGGLSAKGEPRPEIRAAQSDNTVILLFLVMWFAKKSMKRAREQPSCLLASARKSFQSTGSSAHGSRESHP